MVCPFCTNKKTSVYNSRPTKRLGILWRRRRCSACRKEFTTYERIEISGIVNVCGKDGAILPFSKTDLLISLVRACDHRNDDAAYWLSVTIEEAVVKLHAKEGTPVSNKQIRDICIATLKRFDAQALVKYLSYHADSYDAKSLKKQLQGT